MLILVVNPHFSVQYLIVFLSVSFSISSYFRHFAILLQALKLKPNWSLRAPLSENKDTLELCLKEYWMSKLNYLDWTTCTLYPWNSGFSCDCLKDVSRLPRLQWTIAMKPPWLCNWPTIGVWQSQYATMFVLRNLTW